MTRYYDKKSRIERAIKAIENGKVSINSDGFSGTVQGSRNDTYEVNLRDITCRNGLEACRDLEFNCDPALGQMCYHLLAVKLRYNAVRELKV